MTLPDSVRIVEVGARDGLQNVSRALPPEDRAALVNLLASAGLQHIEAGSFVSPRHIPQMADSGRVFSQIKKKKAVVYSALTPNLKGMEQALEAGVSEVAIFGSASEGFSQKNINCTVAQSLKRFESVMVLAEKHRIPVRGYVSCIIACPYDGDTAPEQVASISQELYRMGCYEISLGDTIGVGTPLKVKRVLEATNRHIPIQYLAAHFHNTYGQALANLYAVLEEGLAIIDASIAGLGGCPYAPGASGNIATEDVVYMLEGMAINTGIDLDKLIQASAFICQRLGIQSRSQAGIALSLNK